MFSHADRGAIEGANGGVDPLAGLLGARRCAHRPGRLSGVAVANVPVINDVAEFQSVIVWEQTACGDDARLGAAFDRPHRQPMRLLLLNPARDPDRSVLVAAGPSSTHAPHRLVVAQQL